MGASGHGADGGTGDGDASLPASSGRQEALDWDALLEGNRGLDCDDAQIEARVEALIGRMSIGQKIEQMHGTVSTMFDSGGDEALGIPALLMNDGPRGMARTYATAFPVGMARGATWDPALEKRVGEAMALELRATGRNMLLAPTINVLRHPGWGRAQETYSEDPYHMAVMGSAFISGAQRHVLACAKHFAANSIENTRFEVSANMDETTLREVYLPHFRIAVQRARVASVMSAYNRVNGIYASENAHLLRDILKDEWGFAGFVVSDWVLGTRSTVQAVNAGLDIEMPGADFFSEDNLREAIDSGDVDEATLDEAVRRILRMKFCFGLDALDAVDEAVVRGDAHRALAYEVALRSIVLLKNRDDALPLAPEASTRIAVYGALASSEETGDRGSSAVLSMPGDVVTPLAGIESAAGDARIQAFASDTPEPAALDAAAEVDTAVVVVGLSYRDEGEFIPTNAEGERGGDRADLGLSAAHVALIEQIAGRARRTMVVLVGGSAILVRDWVDRVDALVMTWYGGIQGGRALGDVLFGVQSPAGRLPVSFARDMAQWPDWDIESPEVDYGGLHGYRRMDRRGDEPEFAFGFGLSYTNFAYGRLELSRDALAPTDTLRVSVDVHNAGERGGDEVVQLYVGRVDAVAERPVRTLQGFARVALPPDTVHTVAFELPAQQLAEYDEAMGDFRVLPGEYRLWVGSSSRDLRLSADFAVSGG